MLALMQMVAILNILYKMLHNLDYCSANTRLRHMTHSLVFLFQYSDTLLTLKNAFSDKTFRFPLTIVDEEIKFSGYLLIPFETIP